MNKKKICTQLTKDDHVQIECQLLQIKGVIGLILTATCPQSDYENIQINSAAWLVADVIDQIRDKLDLSVAEE